jgi:hypothetical protein
MVRGISRGEPCRPSSWIWLPRILIAMLWRRRGLDLPVSVRWRRRYKRSHLCNAVAGKYAKSSNQCGYPVKRSFAQYWGLAIPAKIFRWRKEAGKGSGGRAFSTNAAPLPGCFDCPAESSETRDVNATPEDASACPSIANNTRRALIDSNRKRH